jgi:hypothetical protein
MAYHGQNAEGNGMAGTAEIEREKERLTGILSTQYAQGLIELDGYERLVEFAGKAETGREIEYLRKIIDTNETYALKKTAVEAVRPENRPKTGFFAALANLLAKKQNIKKVKLFSGTYELRLHDIDFVENRLTLQIKNFGGDAFIHVSENTAVENSVQVYGGKCVMDGSADAGSAEIKNRLVITGANFGGSIHIKTVR